MRTRKIQRTFNLDPDARFFSGTGDGRLIVLSVDRNQQDRPAHLSLFDTDTGLAEEIPADWFDVDDHNPFASISGDGRLVSAFTYSGPADSPFAVSVYDWRTKKLIARQNRGLHGAGGIEGGGLAEDGRIEFWNNRTGSEIVDSKTGKTVLFYGPNSVRSPDGRWVVELPGYLHGREREESAVLNGQNGQKVSTLEGLVLPEAAVSWEGTFCGTTRRLVVSKSDDVRVFQVPSGKLITSIPIESWRDKEPADISRSNGMRIACSWDGKRVAIRAGARLTLHDLK